MRIVLSILLITLVGCHSGWNKDPFEDKSENIKNAKPGGDEPVIPPLKDVVFIDTFEFYDFYVGRERSLTFEYRVIHPDLAAIELDIPNVEETLPGSTYDKDTATLKWKPPIDFVDGARFMRRLPIDLVLYVENNGVVEEHRKRVAINIIRNTVGVPRIVRVSGLSAKIKEGNFDNFIVTVKDKDGDLQNMPSLAILSTSTGDRDGTGLVYNLSTTPNRDNNDKTLWHFDMRVDVRSKEVTKYYDEKNFGLRAVSGLGAPSIARTESFRVLTQIVKPMFFMENTVFYKNQENSYTFSVVDPRTEGDILVNSNWESTCAGLNPAAVCSCKSNGAQATCNIRWKPAATGVKKFTIKASNTINKQNLQDDIAGKSSFKINVREAGN